LSHAKSAEYLRLHQIRLEEGAQWAQDDSGLQFVFPTQGSAVCVSPNSSLVLRPGDVLVKPGYNKSGIISRAKMCVFSIFSLCAQHLMPLLTAGEASLFESVTERLKPAKVFPAPSHVATECHRLISESPLAPLELRGQLLRVATTVLNDEFQSLRDQRLAFTETDKHVLQALDRMSLNEFVDLPVQKLAAKLGCSRRHLNRLFQQHFRSSVAALKMELRLQRATSLLTNPTIKIIDVAAQSGFNHLGLFNECFRKRFGASPTQWRKRNDECSALPDAHLIQVLASLTQSPEHTGPRPVQGYSPES